MNLRHKLLHWLAGLPGVSTPKGRRELLALTPPESPCRDLGWYGTDDEFVERLLDTLSDDGRKAVLAFLAALHSLPGLQDDAGRRQQLADLERRLEALDDAAFDDAFLPSSSALPEPMIWGPYDSPDFAFAAAGDEPPPAPVPEGEGQGAAGSKEVERSAPPPAPRAPEPGPGGQQTHGDQINTGGGAVFEHAEAGRDVIGGDQVGGSKYEATTINIYQGSEGPAPESPLIEEAIRLDVAAPPSAVQEVPFDLAVAVRQPGAPVLAIEDLSQVRSQDGVVFRHEEDEIVEYRIAVTAAGCDVQPLSYTLWLRPRANSAPCWFQLTPHRAGRQSIIVTAYQQDDAIAATTRVSIEIQVPVAPGG